MDITLIKSGTWAKPKSMAIWALALVVLFSCSKDDSASKANEFVERSVSYERQGQYRAALIEVRNAIQTDPENQAYIGRYADLLITVGSPNGAEDILRSANVAGPDNILRLAEAQLKQGKYISARETLDRYPQDSTDNEQYQRLSALQTFFAGDRNTALSQYRALSDNADTALSIKKEFISLLLQNNNLSEARDVTRQLLAQTPEDPELLYYDARLFQQQNKLTDAERQLTQALIYLPDTDMLLDERRQVLELLITVLTSQGKSTEAFVYNKVIREANPEAFIAQQQYEAALEAVRNDDLVTARAAFEDILNQFPNNQQAALLLGLINIDEGNFSEAESLLSQNINAETAPVTLIEATALAQTEQGKPEEALAVLEKALLARPDDTTLLSLYGVISLNNNKPEDGVKALSKALQLDPDRTRLHLLLSQYYVAQNQNDQALGHLRKAFSQSPEDWATTGFYLSVLTRNDEAVEAKRIRDQIARDYVDNESAMWLVAMADFQLGDIDSAITELNRLHSLSPNNLDVTIALANLYQQTEQFDIAANTWIDAVKVNPTSLPYVQNALINKSRTEGVDGTIAWLEKQAAQYPEIALPLHAAAIDLLISTRQLARAQQLGAEYLTSDLPMALSIRASLKRGSAIEKIDTDNFSQALVDVNDALELLPGNVGLTILASQLEFELGNRTGAMDKLDQVLAETSGNSTAINEKARQLAQAGDTKAAYDFLRPIWLDQPRATYADSYLNLVAEHNPSQLENALNEVINVDPDNSSALVSLAALRLTNGNNADAIELYQRALVNSPNIITALNNLAYLMAETQPVDALGFAQRAVELAPESAPILDTYGWVLYLNGQQQEAVSVLEKALELEPDNVEIQQRLEIVTLK